MARRNNSETPRTDRPIIYPIPLRPTFVGQVVLPADMTESEAQYVSRIILTLAPKKLATQEAQHD